MAPRTQDSPSNWFRLTLFSKQIDLNNNLFLREGGWGRNKKGTTASSLPMISRPTGLAVIMPWYDFHFWMKWGKGTSHYKLFSCLEPHNPQRLSVPSMCTICTICTISTTGGDRQTVRSSWVSYLHPLCPLMKCLQVVDDSKALTTKVYKGLTSN